MADDKQHGKGKPGDDFDFASDGVEARPGGQKGGADDSGLGNLPPLSDFESEGGSTTSRGAGRFDSGLPPLGDIKQEVPRPTGGNVRPSSAPKFEEKSAFDTPISDSGLDTPQPPRGSSFQDLTTDSDFSPETPEIGPGPDSDLETPMFDSAFGPAGGFDRTPETNAPTQAMETPMFGDRGSRSSGFGDAFGAATGTSTRGGGTPIPDFSPDTGIPRVPPPMPPMAPMDEAPARGGVGALALVGAIIVALIVGVAGGSFLYDKLPNAVSPGKTEVAKLTSDLSSSKSQVQQLEGKIRDLTASYKPGGPTPEVNIDKLTKEAKDLQDKVAAVSKDLDDKSNQLKLVEADLDQKNNEYATAQKEYDQLVNQTAIERARADGLNKDVQRMQSQVGTLNEATAREASLKQGLAADVNRLEVAVRESMSLTPDKYSYQKRLQDVQQLKNDVENAKVITPALFNRYNELYQRELDLSKAHEYFFAKIPVQDRYGVSHQKWAEALMNGNQSVYFRTLDGQVGIYEQIPNTNPPQYQFRQFLPSSQERQIEQSIAAARTPGYEAKINALAQRELTMQDKTGVQRVFDSL